MSLKQVREIHNIIKNDIINEAYTNIPYSLPASKTSVLDLCCGRGGDMHKYYNSNFKHAIFVDNHADSLDTARERYRKCYNTNTFSIKFISHDLKKQVLVLKYPVDVVVMNFCLNYFFESEEILRTLLKTVSGALKDGGIFVGIALDGDKVKNGRLSTETYNITPGIDFHDDTKIYNKSYIFSFNEKQNDYFDYRGSQTEYLVSLQELDRVALEFNLERVHHNYIQYSEIDVLNFDVIFKYSLKKNDNNYILSPVKFFPSSVDCSLLKIMPHTHSVCSRPDASRFLVNLILKHFSKQINIIVDSTAHVGSDTIAFALRFNKATIFAIEQDYETAQMLEHNIKTCAFNNVTVLNLNCLDFLSQKIEKNIDVLYIDAPWGDNYKKQPSLSLYLNNIELSCVIKEYCSKCELIVLKVPINFDSELFTSKIPDNTINIYSYIVHSMNKFNFLFLKIMD